MKKIILALVAVLAVCGSAKAEDNEKAIAKGYNRVSVIYSPAYTIPTRHSVTQDVHSHNGVGAAGKVHQRS